MILNRWLTAFTISVYLWCFCRIHEIKSNRRGIGVLNLLLHYLKMMSSQAVSHVSVDLVLDIWGTFSVAIIRGWCDECCVCTLYFRQNGYSAMGIQLALNPKLKPLSQLGKPAWVATIPYMWTTSNSISWLLAQFNMKTMHITTKQNACFL